METAGGRRCLGPPHSDDVHLAAMTQRRHVCLLLDLLAALSRRLFPSDTNIGKLRPRAGRPHLHPASRSAEGRLASRRVCRFSSPPQSAPEFLLSAVGEVLNRQMKHLADTIPNGHEKVTTHLDGHPKSAVIPGGFAWTPRLLPMTFALNH